MAWTDATEGALVPLTKVKFEFMSSLLFIRLVPEIIRNTKEQLNPTSLQFRPAHLPLEVCCKYSVYKSTLQSAGVEQAPFRLIASRCEY